MTKIPLFSLLYSIALGAGAADGVAKSVACYEYSIFDTAEPETVPLPYETKVGEPLFSNSLEAVSIEWVRVDGKKVAPALIAQERALHPLVILRASSRIYLYSAQRVALATLRNITKHDDDLYTFTLPKKFDLLEIGYRIRLPSGQLSPELCSRGAVVSAAKGPDGYPRFYSAFAK